MDQEQEIWRGHGTTPQLLLANKMDISNCLVIKWQLDEATICTNASEHVVRDLPKRRRLWRWFSDTEKKLINLVLAQPKRTLRVS